MVGQSELPVSKCRILSDQCVLLHTCRWLDRTVDGVSLTVIVVVDDQTAVGVVQISSWYSRLKASVYWNVFAVESGVRGCVGNC